MNQTLLDPVADKRNFFVFGGGGGNDVFSAVLVAKWIKDRIPDAKVDIGGMVSPAAFCWWDSHSKPLPTTWPLYLPALDVSQHVVVWSDELGSLIPHRRLLSKVIDFIDGVLPEFRDRMGLHDSRLVHLVPSDILKLREDFIKFIKGSHYDCVIAVDVGGDMLCDRHVDTLLTPIADFASLICLDAIKKDVSTYVIEIGWGTDGEALGNIAESMGDGVYRKAIQSSSAWSGVPYEFNNLFDVLVAPIRPGQTLPALIDYLKRGGTRVVTTSHECRWFVDGKKLTKRFPLVLGPETSKITMFSASVICEHRQWLLGGIGKSHMYSAISMGLFLKCINPNWATECDFQDGAYRGQFTYMAVPSYLFDPKWINWNQLIAKKERVVLPLRELVSALSYQLSLSREALAIDDRHGLVTSKVPDNLRGGI